MGRPAEEQEHVSKTVMLAPAWILRGKRTRKHERQDLESEDEDEATLHAYPASRDQLLVSPTAPMEDARARMYG